MKVSIYNKKTIDENDIINVFGMNTKEHCVKTVEKIENQVDIKINLVHLYVPSSLCDVLQDVPMVGSMRSIDSDYKTPNEYIFKGSLIVRVVLLVLILNKFISNYQVKIKN